MLFRTKIFIMMCLFCHVLASQTGINVPSMSSCDTKIQNFITNHSIPGLSIAITKDGKLIYHRAFGNANMAGNETMFPYNLFRIASISKPITSIAIMKLYESGQIAMGDKVFGTGGILENNTFLNTATITDSRIYDITVQNLLEHSSGWDRSINCFPNPTSPYPWYFSGCDPLKVPLHVTATNGTSNPIKDEDIVYYMLEKGLNHAPGTTYKYSNVGYSVLGEIIKEISGMSYEDYVKTEILNSIGICDMHLGKNLLTEKLEREVEYNSGSGSSTYDCYGNNTFVPWDYGGWSVEAMDAHGGWVSSTRDLVRLINAVDGFASIPDILNASTINLMTTPSSNNAYYSKGWRVNPSNNWWHTGALDGTSTFAARTSGAYTWAVFVNKGYLSNAGSFWSDLDMLPWDCITGVTTFPTHNLFDSPTANSTNITFTTVNETSILMSWVNGTGSNRIVVGKENGSISSFPLDGQNYAANSIFEQGEDIGNSSFVVYNGTGSTVNVTNLKPNTSYTFRVFDYNKSSNTGNNALYKLCGGFEKQVTTASNLPVDLADFTINRINNSINLKWSTLSEFNNSHFEIEKSTNGITFDRIGKVPGKANSNSIKLYSYEDRASTLGTLYYRIKQVDLNGEFQYSEIKSISIYKNDDVKIYPTIASNYISIELTTNFENLSYQIFTPSGTLCKEGDFDSSINSILIDDLNRGIYIIQINSTNGLIKREKFIKN